ncbi:hypothetical protein J3R82DRAFT_7698 [Butyriboletus roseoflavus]|nr:hypothetical protein J3R82DRAFT_7698 [Butyriboletus roseoflavus]
MSPNINLTTAFFTGLITFSLLYGVYFVLFLGSLYVLFYKKMAGQVNSIILGGTILQFILISVCYGIRWDRIYTAFITNGGTPDGPLLFLAQLNDWRELSSTALWAVTGALGDVMFIYRLYIVWDYRLQPCLAPLALLTGSLASTIGLISVLERPITTAYTINLTRWVYAFLSFNLAQNILVNVLIIARIWRINARATSLRIGATLWPTVVVLMESGALYSSFVLVFLVTYACQNNAAMIMTDMVLPIMGIAFNIIIVRVGISSKDNSTGKSGSNSHGTVIFTHHPTNSIAYPLSNFTETAPSPEDGKGGGTLDRHDFEYA